MTEGSELILGEVFLLVLESIFNAFFHGFRKAGKTISRVFLPFVALLHNFQQPSNFLAAALAALRTAVVIQQPGDSFNFPRSLNVAVPHNYVLYFALIEIA